MTNQSDNQAQSTGKGSEDIERLINAIEQKAGYKVRTPKDFERLHALLFEECHTMVSVSTLKRIWGYIQSDGIPRQSSLDPLAQYAGYHDWEDFCNVNSLTPTAPEKPEKIKQRWKWPWAIAFVVISALIAFFCYFQLGDDRKARVTNVQTTHGRVLRKGQDCFRSIDDYLALFAIEGGDTAYFRPIPGLNYVYVWGPEYGHPVWHNEGDSTKLMPTITEYYIPLPGTADYQNEEYVKLANEKLYYERWQKDELRLTFMRNIVNGFYVFLGVYRMDRELSTTEKFVWKRVADDCDLSHLELLDKLREKDR